MDLTVSLEDDVAIVEISGRLDMEGVQEVEDRFLRGTSGARHVVVDVSGVDYASSTALRMFIGKARAVQDAGGTMVMCRLQPLVRNVFHLACLDRIFPVLDTRDQALARAREQDV